MFKRILMLLLALVLLCTASAMAEDIHGYDKKQGGYSYVTFGTFPLDAAANEAPILWRVLDVQGQEAFLLTEYIVDVHYVHLDTSAYYTMKWEESDLYAYLQTDFMNRAFSTPEQQALLQRTEDGALVTLAQIDDVRNKAYGFADNKSRLCGGTEYAISIGLYQYGDDNSPWISRNKSKDRPQQQRRVMDEGKLGTVPCGNVDLGIRPCVYVDLAQLEIAGGSGTKDDPFRLIALNAGGETLPQQATPAPTSAPVMDNPNAGDDLSQLIDQLALEKDEPTPAPTAEPTQEPTSAPTEIPAAAPTPEPVQVPAVNEQAPAPAATPFTVGGIVYQNDDGVVITSLKVVTPAPTREPTPVPTQAPKATEEPREEPAPDAQEEPADNQEEEKAPVPGDVFPAGADPKYIHASFPQLTAEGFLPEGEDEFILEDKDNGLWLYANQTLRIQIERKDSTNSKKKPLRWYEARIFTRDNSQLFDLFPWDEAKYTNHYTLTYADEIARKHNLVFAINSDYFIYRVARQHDKDVNYNYPKGLIIRDGKVFYDVPRGKNSTVYPPLDVLALFPDGTMKAYPNGTMTADQMLKTGAIDTLSFGPILVENGQYDPRSEKYGTTVQPRTGIGYVEPGHYVCILVEGRTDESDGETCSWLGKKMEELGCELAINLDGGATSTMLFMGNQVNKSGKYGDITNRKQNELIGIGISDKVAE